MPLGLVILISGILGGVFGYLFGFVGLVPAVIVGLALGFLSAEMRD